MPVHLYGVLDAADAPASTAHGLDGQPLRVLPLGARSAWVSDVVEPTLLATPQRLRDHDAVLRGAIASGFSVIPSLFGRLHASDAALAAALTDNERSLEDAMLLVRDRVEMSFLVAPSGIPPQSEPEVSLGAVGPGRAHLRRIQHQVHGERILHETASAFASIATQLLSDLLVAEREVDSPAPPVLVARAHLVARDDIARYLRAAGLQAAGAAPSLRLAVRGPGAAYSFAAVQIG